MRSLRAHSHLVDEYENYIDSSITLSHLLENIETSEGWVGILVALSCSFDDTDGC